jgi:hypothetical protein
VASDIPPLWLRSDRLESAGLGLRVFQIADGANTFLPQFWVFAGLDDRLAIREHQNVDTEIHLPPAKPDEPDRVLAEILRGLCARVIEDIAPDGLLLLRQQSLAIQPMTAAERAMLKMIEARLARPYGSRNSAPNK